MDHHSEPEVLIELGAATAQTCGKTGPIVDFMLGQAMAGLEDE